MVTVNRNRLEICDWRFTVRTGIPRGTAGRPDRGRGAVPSASLMRIRTKPECPLVSSRLCSRLHSRSRIQIVKGRRRSGGLEFWVPRPRHWTRQRQVKVMLGREPVEPERHRGTESEKKWLALCLCASVVISVHFFTGGGLVFQTMPECARKQRGSENVIAH